MKSSEIYSSIDAPIKVWEKVHKSGDLSHLYVKPKKVTKKDVPKLQAAWEKIYDEYLSEFGLTETFADIMELKRQIALANLRVILTGDRIYVTEAKIKEIELAELERVAHSGSIMDAKKAIEMQYKFQLNMNTTSIREFYSYLKDIK